MIAEKGRGLVQEETLSDSRFGEGYTRQVEARYTVGSGDNALALIAETNGYLHQLPVGWFATDRAPIGSLFSRLRQGGEWRLNPGYELQNHRFDRVIAPGCIACHGTLANYIRPTRNRYEAPIVRGISCQRCHGPGADHVAYRDVAYWEDENESPVDQSTKAARLIRKSRASEGDYIVNPGRLSAERANDICLQCHLQGDVSVYQPGCDESSFRPGERLADHRLDFLVKTNQPEAFGIASHGARMMRSTCYLASGQKLTCIHCHDPHISARLVSRDQFDAKCATCHVPESCSRPFQPIVNSRESSCVKCHMPQRSTREGRHLVFTDHWIRSPAVEKEPASPVIPPNATAELVPMWPLADPHQLRLGSAAVLFHETMGPQLPSLQRGVELLEGAVASGQADADARYWLASGLISLRQSQRAADLFQGILQNQPQHHLARFRLGIAFDQMQRFDAAIAEYETVLRATPDWLEPYPLLARLYLVQRQPEKAAKLMEQRLQFLPDPTALTFLIAAKGMQGASAEECLKLAEAALRLDPKHVLAHLATGQLQLQLGNKALAAESFNTVLQLDPANIEAREELQRLRP